MREPMPWYLIPFHYCGEVSQLLGQSLWYILRLKVPVRLTIQQMSLIGVNSLSIVFLTITFTGMVIALQTASEFARFGAGQFVGAMVAVAMAREIAPALTGVVVAGRAGSAIAAELGTMAVSEQIDALRAMAVSPIYYLAVPRLLACILMLPLLTIFANLSGIGGGYLVAVHFSGINPHDFFESATTFLRLHEFVFGLLKASVFGAIICMVSCHQGLTTREGAFGVGKATTNSVVLSMIFTFIANTFLSVLMFGGQRFEF